MTCGGMQVTVSSFPSAIPFQYNAVVPEDQREDNRILITCNPGYFAGLLLVSGQSDPEEMRATEGDNIWIIVSEGDKRGFPGMNASVEAWEQDGVVIAKSTWDTKSPAEDME